MQNMEARIKNCEDRIATLEEHCHQYKDSNNKIRVDLGKTVIQINNLINVVDKLPENLEKTMLKSIELQAKDHEEKYKILDIRFDELRKDNENNKKELETLKKIIDERTIIKDSKNYQKYIFEIVKYIILAGLGVALVIK